MTSEIYDISFFLTPTAMKKFLTEVHKTRSSDAYKRDDIAVACVSKHTHTHPHTKTHA